MASITPVGTNSPQKNQHQQANKVAGTLKHHHQQGQKTKKTQQQDSVQLGSKNNTQSADNHYVNFTKR